MLLQSALWSRASSAITASALSPSQRIPTPLSRRVVALHIDSVGPRPICRPAGAQTRRRRLTPPPRPGPATGRPGTLARCGRPVPAGATRLLPDALRAGGDVGCHHCAATWYLSGKVRIGPLNECHQVGASCVPPLLG
jgi:hypothetical protein